MSMLVATELATNAARLVRTRLVGVVSPASANAVVSPAGLAEVLPGQGGVLTSVQLGDAATGWCSDHLEVGASIRHPEPAADQALQVLACIGNKAVVLDGPASAARGMVAGKHGALLVAFPSSELALIGPGDRVAIEAFGSGLRLAGEDRVVLHSCDPALLEWLLDGTEPDGRLRIRIAAIFAREAAGAGLGMPASRFNIDLDPALARDPVTSAAANLRLGDIVAVADQDHRCGRRFRAGWLAVGVLCHGRSAAGGHGVGMATLLTGPTDRLGLAGDAAANLKSFWLAAAA
jgi:Domain of unknown function (DUF4438)